MRNLLNAVALLSLAVAAVPGFSADQAHPGTVNYVEGTTLLDGTPLNFHDVGSIEAGAGQVLSTTLGKAEMLLTPGIFLRLDENSAVKMISPDLTLTQVEIERGKAGVEVDEIYPQNNIQVVEGGVVTRLLKPGYYEFDSSKGTAMVFKGEAAVEVGNGAYKNVKEHHEFTVSELSAGKSLDREKPVDFDANSGQDDLYNWSNLRSNYLAQANNQLASEYAGGSGFYPGWYWDPYGWDYTFIGAGPFWSPFGWGFYPFGWGGLYGGGFYGRGFYGHGYAGGGFAGGGFHGGGGFSGGGGGGHR